MVCFVCLLVFCLSVCRTSCPPACLLACLSVCLVCLAYLFVCLCLISFVCLVCLSAGLRFELFIFSIVLDARLLIFALFLLSTIAAATLASGDVDLCLVPESDIVLEGPRGCLPHVLNRVREHRENEGGTEGERGGREMDVDLYVYVVVFCYSCLLYTSPSPRD